MIAKTGPFPRAERIRRSREFQALSRKGRRRPGDAFVLLSAPTAGRGGARLGLTVSRRVGNAVVRNAVKRRIREWFRRVGRDALGARDIVVIARPPAAACSTAEIFDELTALAASLGAAR